jgi:hypothetical protein
MEYTVDGGQLLGVWTVERLMDQLRETYDPIDQSDLFMEAQVLLTELLVGLKPWSRQQVISVMPEVVSIN